MKRREFITLLGGAAAAWPLDAHPQQRARRIGVLVGTGSDSQSQSWLAAFRRRLQELGWSDARDLQIDVRWGSADIDYIHSSAADLVSSKSDVMLVYGVRALNAIRQATRQIPVVFIATSDPVGLGLVESLAHPGGNLTGFMLYKVSLAAGLLSFSRIWCRILSGLLWSVIPSIPVLRATGTRSKLLQNPAMLSPFHFPFATSPTSWMRWMRSRASRTAASCSRLTSRQLSIAI